LPTFDIHGPMLYRHCQRFSNSLSAVVPPRGKHHSSQVRREGEEEE
jgi:hypothetical protein